MSSEYFTRTSLYLVRLKTFEWMKFLRRHLHQVQGNWAGRNFVTESRVNSRLITTNLVLRVRKGRDRASPSWATTYPYNQPTKISDAGQIFSRCGRKFDRRLNFCTLKARLHFWTARPMSKFFVRVACVRFHVNGHLNAWIFKRSKIRQTLVNVASIKVF